MGALLHTEATTTRVMPDGCIDVVRIEGTGTQPVGANTTAFSVSLAPGVHVVGARMRPGAAAALLGVSGEAVRDTRGPAQAILDRRRSDQVAALDGDHRPMTNDLTLALGWVIAYVEDPAAASEFHQRAFGLLPTAQTSRSHRQTARAARRLRP